MPSWPSMVNSCKEGNWAAKSFGPKKLQLDPEKRDNFLS